MMKWTKRASLGIGLAVMFAGGGLRAEGNIDPVWKFAWSENAGWINFAPANGGVEVTRAGLSGLVWAENIGWIKLAAAGSTYENTTQDNWGVFPVEETLHGYAWSENIGWINMAPKDGGVKIENGVFSGYAWSENIGWIHFPDTSSEYGVRTSARLESGSVVVVR